MATYWQQSEGESVAYWQQGEDEEAGEADDVGKV